MHLFFYFAIKRLIFAWWIFFSLNSFCQNKFSEHQPNLNYPTRAVNLIVPFPAGGGTDIIARMVAKYIGDKVSQPIVIDNRGGAGGTVGTNYAAKSAPDGYTLILVSGSHTINPSVYTRLPYNTTDDFSPISLIAKSPSILVINPKLPVKNVNELIEYSRNKPDELGFASAGYGTPPHLAGSLFNEMAHLKLLHVPYKGNASALADVIAGHVGIAFPTAPSAIELVRSGKLRALAITSLQRSPLVPDLPTISESGISGYDLSSWYGLLAPAKTDKSIVNALNELMIEILNNQKIKDKFIKEGLDPSPTTPDQFSEIIRTEIPKWKKIINQSSAKFN